MNCFVTLEEILAGSTSDQRTPKAAMALWEIHQARTELMSKPLSLFVRESLCACVFVCLSYSIMAAKYCTWRLHNCRLVLLGHYDPLLV